MSCKYSTVDALIHKYFYNSIFLRSKTTSYSSCIVWNLQDISTNMSEMNIHSFVFADMLLVFQIIETSSIKSCLLFNTLFIKIMICYVRSQSQWYERL